MNAPDHTVTLTVHTLTLETVECDFNILCLAARGYGHETLRAAGESLVLHIVNKDGRKLGTWLCHKRSDSAIGLEYIMYSEIFRAPTPAEGEDA